MNPNEELVRAYLDQVWNQRNEDLLQAPPTESTRVHGLLDEDGRGASMEEYRRFYRIMTTAFPDATLRVLRTMARGDEAVAIHFEIAMTHLGEFMGVPATGRKVRCECMALMTFRDGQIVETRTTWDLARVLAVIGGLDHLDGAEALARP